MRPLGCAVFLFAYNREEGKKMKNEGSVLKTTICDTVEAFLRMTEKHVASFKEIYEVTKEKWPNESVRASVYRDPYDRFEKVARGVFLLKGETSQSLLIEGDSRSLSEIEDGSIAAIVNDHPWKDEKAHKSGNQKNFADYDTFHYTQEDFINKARVLKDGGYLAEFLPVRSATNKDYLNKIEAMAESAGLSFYANLFWHKVPEGKINTGRTTKGVEQIYIFYKGKKPRCLNRGGLAYQTSGILNLRLDFPVGKSKNHQAEKPVELYEYLLRQLSAEGDICLDQFGGSCNMVKAATSTGRFSIVYEICKDFVEKAVSRFKLEPLGVDCTENASKCYIVEARSDNNPYEQISLYAV